MFAEKEFDHGVFHATDSQNPSLAEEEGAIHVKNYT